MKLQESIPLSSIFGREEDFSEYLAGRLDALKVGQFDDKDVETESLVWVGKHRADIVASDGEIVVENQFGKANWDHWGRLEAYARFYEARVAALVAEDFNDLMILTCRRRNEESNTDWYLIRVQANSHEELSFHHVAGPARDKVERNLGNACSEFWVPTSMRIHNIEIHLNLNREDCHVRLRFNGKDRVRRRDETLALFSESELSYERTESNKEAYIKLPVLDKGKNDRGDWEEIRKELDDMGTRVYNRIAEHHE